MKEFQKRETLEVDGFECEVFFNKVEEGKYGFVPMNVWMAVLKPNEHNMNWSCDLKEGTKTLKEAVTILRPQFETAIKRFLATHETVSGGSLCLQVRYL